MYVLEVIGQIKLLFCPAQYPEFYLRLYKHTHTNLRAKTVLQFIYSIVYIVSVFHTQ